MLSSSKLLAMKGIIWLFIIMLFLQLFGGVRPEGVSFYFSVYENRALYTRSTVVQSTFAKDLMLCARACGAESNCNAVNYNSENNECELFKEHLEDVLHGAAVITARGYYLLTKVTIHLRFVSLTIIYNYLRMSILDPADPSFHCNVLVLEPSH